MFLCNLLGLCLITLQNDQALDESAILQEYRRNVPEIVDVYSNNIFVKERYTQKSATQLISSDYVRSMYFCDQYVFTHKSSSSREEVDYASNKAFFKIIRMNNSPSWLLAYNLVSKDNSNSNLLRKSLGQRSLLFPYKPGIGTIDIRDLLGVIKEEPPVRDKPKYPEPEWKLVKIRKALGDQQTRYRFYYRMGEAVPTEKLDDIPCFGYFDVAPQLHWVIVAERYYGTQTEITYDGEIAGIPAIKKVTATARDQSEPYMTYEILEISDHDQTNPAEHNLRYYGHGSFLEEHGLTGPWHLLFFGFAFFLLIVTVILQRKHVQATKKPSTQKSS